MISPYAPARTDAGGSRRPLRVALVGVGNVAGFHRDALARIGNLELAALCDRNHWSAREAAERWRVPHAVSSIEALIALGIDAAHVLVPPDAHVEVATRLLEAGIATLVEKPLALSAAEAEHLGSLARERGVALAVNHNYLHHPAFLALRDLLHSGAIGTLQHVRICHAVRLPQLEAGQVGLWMFREPRNIMFEQGVHALGLAASLLGPTRSLSSQVLATRMLQSGRPFHQRWLLGMDAEHGSGEVLLSFAGATPCLTIQALGSDGWVEADLDRDLLTWESSTRWLEVWNRFLASWRRSGQLRRGAFAGLRAYSKYTLGLGPRSDGFFLSMVGSISAFYDALERGTEQPAGAGPAAETLRLCEMATASLPAAPAAAAPGRSAKSAARPGEVVVLGATGYIGTRLLERLQQMGTPTTAVVRHLQGLGLPLQRGVEAGWLRVAEASLDDPVALADAIAGADVVLHLATGSGTAWPEIERNMVLGSLRLAELCLAQGVRRLVFVSSIAAVYLGPDSGFAAIPDDHPPDPRPHDRDLYSRGKILAERALQRLRAERGLPLIVVRPGVVVGGSGPLQHPGLGLWVAENHCIGWGLGEHPLPLVLVEDVAEALALLTTPAADGLEGRTLHLCAQPPLSAREMVGELARATGRPLAFHPRPLWASQVMEIGKWLVKRMGRRPAPFPAYRDLKSRGLFPPIPSTLARQRLGWRPAEERGHFLRAALGSGTAARPAHAAGRAPTLLHIFSTFSPGGAELRAIEIMAALPREWRHRVLALDGRTDASAHLPARLKVELLPSPPRAGSVRTFLRLRVLVRRYRPDLLLTYGWGAFDAVLAAASLPGLALVHHEDGFNADEVIRFKLRRILARRLGLRGARAVVVPSRQLERIASELWRLPAARVVRIPNGVRVAAFEAADGNPALRRELGLPPEAVVIGAVGQLRAEKNLGRLLRAFAAVPVGSGLHLLLVGDGPQRSALEAEAVRLGIAERVRFAGHQAVVAPFYRVLDVLAICSDTEQQPRALLESMASGLAVVASDVGDIRAILPPEQARFLVSLAGASAESEFAERFAALAGDPAARSELGKLNRRHATECYDFDQMTHAYGELYGDLLAGALRSAD